jgi:5'-3' exonuclease
MGIPYYFYTLTKSYQNIISSKSPQSCDIYCIDFNGVIHTTCAKMLASAVGPLDEEKLIKTLYEKVIADIQILKPKKVYICVDGTVPLAKMIQQRKRRYLTVYKNKIDGIQTKWDTNAITPGTEFMKKLDIYFRKQVRYNAEATDIYYSGSDEYGEGEHKMFKFLEAANESDAIIINGLDADLIILSLMCRCQNITLMRESENNQYLNVRNLRDAIIHDLTIKWDIIRETTSQKDIIESYCVLCSVLGNDFIPHLLTLNLHNKSDRSLNKLLTFGATAYKSFGLLVQDEKINYTALTDILQNIAKSEDRDIFEETERYIKNVPVNRGLPSDLFGLKHKDPVAQAIYNDISKWRHTYYKHLFYTNTMIDTSVINMACSNYIKGIYWTYAYYKRQGYDNQWYYPYGYPPTIRDIANYVLGTEAPPAEQTEKSHDNLRKIQTLIVLPKESMSVVCKTSAESPALQHLYPTQYTIHTYLKTHLWECVPELPIINIEYITRHIR